MGRVGLRRKRIPTQLTDREATIMEYFEPKSISEALSVLVKHGAEAKVIAGGTEVMVDIKFKEEPGSLENIKKLPARGGIKENAGRLYMCALPTNPALATNALEPEKQRLVWEAA